MSKHVLSLLVEDKPGLLTRVAGLFARRLVFVSRRDESRRADPIVAKIAAIMRNVVASSIFSNAIFAIPPSASSLAPTAPQETELK